MSRILVVDDDPRIVELLVTTLRLAGFRTAAAGSGAHALRCFDRGAPDLLILDVILPDLDGFEVARRLRQDGHRCPLLFLTARDGTDNTVTGLGVGGDDYVTKPFSVAEVIARVRALLRRAGGDGPSDLLSHADLTLDDARHEVRRAGELIDLSPTEYRLLRYLLLNAGRVVSKAQIVDRVWHQDFGGDGQIVEKFVSQLRRRIDHHGPPLLHTVRGFGYVLRTPPR